MLSQEVPYGGLEQTAIIYGVGSNTLHVPVPESFPDGFRIIISMCLCLKPRKRPSFARLQQLLDMAVPDFDALSPEHFAIAQRDWKAEIARIMHAQKQNSGSARSARRSRTATGLDDARGGESDALVEKRRRELKHARVSLSVTSSATLLTTAQLSSLFEPFGFSCREKLRYEREYAARGSANTLNTCSDGAFQRLVISILN